MEDPLLWHSDGHAPIKTIFSEGVMCCPVCESKNVETQECYTDEGLLIGIIKLAKCGECGEIFISEEVKHD